MRTGRTGYRLPASFPETIKEGVLIVSVISIARNHYLPLRRRIDTMLMWLKSYCVAVMLAMLVIAFVQVIRRYAFNIPWSWSDEIVLLLLAWFAYPSIVFNTWKDDHFYIGAIYEKMPRRLRKGADIFRHLVQGVVLALLAWFGMKLMLQNWPKAMPASGWSQGIKFIPVIFGAGLSTVFCVINLAGVLIGQEIPEGGANK